MRAGTLPAMRRRLGPALGIALIPLVGVAACGSRTGLLVSGSVETLEAGDVSLPDVDSSFVPQCKARSCAEAGWTCGENGDGCGGVIQCGDCPTSQRCGSKGFSVCGPGPMACTPQTCQQLGDECGPAADGCGGLLQCGTCLPPLTCGAQAPWRCGSQCTNLCHQQVVCDSGSTTVSGTVVAGTLPLYGSPDPISGAIVYVPNATVQPFAPGVACNQCGADVSGSPLVETQTAPDGTFTLQNVPVGNNIPLVIQLGRWRRQITISTVTACADNPLTVDQTRMPRNRSEGDIPRTAIATGAADALECVLMKMGVDQAEFTLPTSTGRVHMFVSNGADDGIGTPGAESLWGNPQQLALYDQVILPCEGAPNPKSLADQTNIIAYANSGGRIFTTHYGYVWLYNDPPFSQTAVWSPGTGGQATQDAFVDLSSPTAMAFQAWLQIVGALSGPSMTTLMLQQTRADFTAVNPPSEELLYTNSPTPEQPLQYDFYTPVGQPLAQQCGRVFYSDFHVVDANNMGSTFPGECTAAPMTPQEKALEFLLFDLGSCVPGPVTCAPQTCAQQGIDCGQAGDGCGKSIQCGSCKGTQSCGGAGSPGKCGGIGGCNPQTCKQLGFDCGINGDGCGGVVDCGSCKAPQICGGGGTPSVCGP